jgi:hypothetical protein
MVLIECEYKQYRKLKKYADTGTRTKIVRFRTVGSLS